MIDPEKGFSGQKVNSLNAQKRPQTCGRSQRESESTHFKNNDEQQITKYIHKNTDNTGYSSPPGLIFNREISGEKLSQHQGKDPDDLTKYIFIQCFSCNRVRRKHPGQVSEHTQQKDNACQKRKTGHSQNAQCKGILCFFRFVSPHIFSAKDLGTSDKYHTRSHKEHGYRRIKPNGTHHRRPYKITAKNPGDGTVYRRDKRQKDLYGKQTEESL